MTARTAWRAFRGDEVARTILSAHAYGRVRMWRRTPDGYRTGTRVRTGNAFDVLAAALRIATKTILK
jgi:hypothetical protein